MKRTVVGTMLTLLFISVLTSLLALTFDIQLVEAEEIMDDTIIRIIPEEIILGSPALENVINTTFTIAVVIENVTDLYGFDIQWCWNTTYLEYLNHTTTVPVEDYPYPIPPSPYPGILHPNIMKLKEAVDESASIPLAEPGTMAWIGYSGSIAFSFYGSGTVCIMTFRVKHQPYFTELPEDFDYVHLTFRFIRTDLSTPVVPIPHEVKDGIVKLYAQPLPPYSPTARFTVTPEIAKRLESVEFDASGSLPGFNGTHEVPIVRYYWNFGDGSNMTMTEDPIVHHRFTHLGIYHVTLTVYSPEAYPVTDSTTRKVTVLCISVGGYSFPIKGYTITKPLTIYLALVAILTVSFTMIKRKIFRRTKQS